MNPVLRTRMLFQLIAFVAFGASISIAQTPPASNPSKHPSLLDRRAVCKFNKAAAHLPVLKGAARFKSNASALHASISSINTDAFCDCTFDQLESAYGAAHVREMGGYQYADKIPPAQLNAENLKTEAIYFSCLGRQTAQPNLTPPTGKEVRSAIAKPPNSKMSAKNEAIFKKIQLAIAVYKSTKNLLPRQPKDLVNTQLLTANDINDEWGNAVFLKRMANGTVRIISFGPDGKPGTADDIEQ